MDDRQPGPVLERKDLSAVRCPECTVKTAQSCVLESMLFSHTSLFASLLTSSPMQDLHPLDSKINIPPMNYDTERNLILQVMHTFVITDLQVIDSIGKKKAAASRSLGEIPQAFPGLNNHTGSSQNC